MQRTLRIRLNISGHIRRAVPVAHNCLADLKAKAASGRQDASNYNHNEQMIKMANAPPFGEYHLL